MKISKVSFIAALVAAAVLVCGPALRAQDKAGKREGRPPAGEREQMMKARLDKMAEELKLNSEQKTKVEALMKEQGEKMRGLRDATPEERREKGRTLRQEMDKKMKEILTSEQYEKWQKTRQEGRGPGGFGGKEKGGKKKAE